MRWFGWLALGLAASAACSSTKKSGFDDASTDDGGIVGDDAGSFGRFGESGTVGDCTTRHCSVDLHQVLDCNDTVLMTCPADQACGPGGTCISPCESAAYNKTAIGCDFYAQNPAPDDEAAGSCYAALLANTWNAPITVDVEYGGTKLTGDFLRVVSSDGTLKTAQNGQVAPGDVGVVFLSAKARNPPLALWTACPDGPTPAFTQDYAFVYESAIGHAFHVTTSAPVTAYDVYPYGGATSYITSASLLLPTPVWDTNYVAADGYASAGNISKAPYLQITAAQDGTNVTISPTADIAPGTQVAGTAKGVPQTYTLNKGQFIQFLQMAELAGSIIQSNNPVAVWGGLNCANIPTTDGMFCDSLHQQLPSVQLLGHSYAAVRYRNRVAGVEEQVPWRFVGAVDGTTLTFDPPGTLTLAQGQLVEYWSTGPFTVSSQDDQHPFYVSGHMTGEVGPGYGVGDPDYVNIVPPEAWLPSYLFLTDPTYANTNLVFVRGKANDGTFKDVSLDCMGTLTGWQPIGSRGQYEYTRADLIIGNVNQGNCTNGVHTAVSAAPFALTVWGWDTDVSYAYPAGMATKPINSVVIPPNAK
jgi:hypothetical protein